MDIMDIQAVESKLNDVTVTPIPRSQVQNFYNYQQQREQREQQPQIQISAIHHAPRSTNSSATNNISITATSNSSSGGGIKRERDYHHHQSASNSAAVAAAALQYTQQLQAQLALLQQQANTTASPASSASLRTANTVSNNAATNLSQNGTNGSTAAATAVAVAAIQSQLKYPQSTSPVILPTSVQQAPTNNASLSTNAAAGNCLNKYAQLLAVIEEMGRDIRPTYTGSRTSTERLKRGLVHARILVRECLMETERSARQ